MNRDKSTRVRRDSRHNARAINTTKDQDSDESFENELSENPKSTSTPVRREQTTSSSSVRNSRRQSVVKQISSEESANGVDPEDSTYSKYDDSGSNRKNNNHIDVVDSMRKVEEFLTSDYTRSNENRESESPHDNHARREKRRKSKKRRREKNRTSNSSVKAEDDDDEERRSSERDLSRSRSRKSRSTGNRKFRRKKGSKAAKSKEGNGEDEERELPITEILRKAQENPKNRYEEPPPLAELTTDRIYVQGRNGFSAVKISGERCNNGIFARRRSQGRATPILPIKVAIVAQKIWNSAGFIHQGLFAGIALMHFLLMQTFFRLSLDFLIDYSLISEYYGNIFSYLAIFCVVSAFDRFDLAQLDIEHFREIYVEHSRSFLAIPLYIATFCLHQTSLRVDDNISLMNYPRNTTGFENNSTSNLVEEDLIIWHKVTLAKDSLAVLAWLFVALGPREDMLLTHLRAMEKYVESVEISG